MTDVPELIVGGQPPSRLRKWRVRLNRLRRVTLWGAAGLVHALFDAPRPRVTRSRSAMPVDRTLVAEIGGLERVYRFPYWMMEGYAEELYRVDR